MSISALTYFCDDIRFEQGNKTSYMGVYATDLVVPTAPFVLPKICCAISVNISIDEHIESLIFRIKNNEGIVLAEASVPNEGIAQLVQHVQTTATPDDPVQQYALTMSLVLSPYIITEAHVLRTVVILNGKEEVPAGWLRIVVGQQKQQDPSSDPNPSIAAVPV